MAMLLFLFVVISLASSCQGNIPEVAAGKPQASDILDCLSWRVANEANNTVGWDTVPPACKEYVNEYLLGSQYLRDSEFIINEAITYAQSHPLPSGRNIWVFDVDDTTLSNVDNFINNGLSSKSELLPALPETKRLYKELLSLQFKIVFLTERNASTDEASTIHNLTEEGFENWERIILKTDEFKNNTAAEYKSKSRTKLVEEGYIIAGNIGDQWSDISGPYPGMRMFKLPNPMYYIP